MEQPKPSIAQFEEDGVLKPVSETAMSIAYYLGELSIKCDVDKFESGLKITIDREDAISVPAYYSIVEEFTKHGVVITFNEDEQTIQVSPFSN